MLHSIEMVIEFARFVASTLAPIRYNLIRQNNDARSFSSNGKTFTFYYLLESYAFIKVFLALQLEIVNCLLLTHKYLINKTWERYESIYRTRL